MGNTEDRAARIAVSPALFVLLVEGIVWGMSAVTDWGVWIAVGAFALLGGALAAIVAIPLILVGGT
jgi:hypothetical protein